MLADQYRHFAKTSSTKERQEGLKDKGGKAEINKEEERRTKE
jgi:hypothetical protein